MTPDMDLVEVAVASPLEEEVTAASSLEAEAVAYPPDFDEKAFAVAHPEVTYRAPAPVAGALPLPGGLAYRAVKRVFDLVFSACVTVILAIPVALACLATRLESPGSPIFCQDRIGKDGQHFHIYKIRTMYADAHEHPERYLDEDQLKEWTLEQKIDHDPRITRVGRVLRTASLDELPQFLNVLKGDLSVIGPRPVTEAETWQLANARDEFLSCKPGITGWWQVTSRNDATWADGERQGLELFYVRHASLSLDVRIFVRTFRAMARKTGR